MKSLYYTPCFDCGCGLYSYSKNNLAEGIYKITCTDCGRNIERERAEEILKQLEIVE